MAKALLSVLVVASILACSVAIVDPQDYARVVASKLGSFSRFEEVQAPAASDASDLTPSVTSIPNLMDPVTQAPKEPEKPDTVQPKVAVVCVLLLTGVFFVGEFTLFTLGALERLMDITAKEKTAEEVVDHANDAFLHSREQEAAEANKNIFANSSTHVETALNMILPPVPMLAILILAAHYFVEFQLGFSADGATYPPEFELCYQILVFCAALNFVVGLISVSASCCCHGDASMNRMAEISSDILKAITQLAMAGAVGYLFLLIFTTGKYKAS